MSQANTLRRHGLFDARVPRYTSYPPANRFEQGTGARHQREWMAQVRPDEPVSVYVHIPFCKRLCWFCACRTQGTQTLTPVENYVNTLIGEISSVATEHLPKGIQMARLHLGGGTPTILSGPLMTKLLDSLHASFGTTPDFEFSVEIDPTEAADDVLKTLARHGMNRASIGVQDFEPRVQKAIGRKQGFDITKQVVETLRAYGVSSLNIDVLYGLPHQTASSLNTTLDKVVSLRPDRIALYGYAHVPHVSKRQMMISAETLPDPEQRYELTELARERLLALGYNALGIDHFALPHDSLKQAADAGQMKRNFQGYTDDPCETLIGFGASAISQFRQGYSQNAVSTSAYQQRVQTTGVAAHKGIVLSPDDAFIGAMINSLMCDGMIQIDAVRRKFPDQSFDLDVHVHQLMLAFPELLTLDEHELSLKDDLMICARLIAAYLDRLRAPPDAHSLAV